MTVGSNFLPRLEEGVLAPEFQAIGDREVQ
jgi:hypothetical protein